MKSLLLIASALMFSVSAPVMASGNADAGKSKAGMCSACHGADGNSMVPMYPKIAGQHAQYLNISMKAYRDGQRTGGNAAIMTPMAKNLSDQDIADLAAFYSQQTAK